MKLSEKLSNKEIDKMYLMTIPNPICREEIRRLLEEVKVCSIKTK